jgi:putative hydrolase of the HAD superfamily
VLHRKHANPLTDCTKTERAANLRISATTSYPTVLLTFVLLPNLIFLAFCREAIVPDITSLFWDIGGVILTNGWDHNSRAEAVKAFNLDGEEFRDRHDLSFPAFDAGEITLDQYLDRTLFYRSRTFSKEDFTGFMFAQSKEYPETRAVLDHVARSGKYYVASINNEPRELNDYRIEAFNLRRDFQAFFSSCYLSARKPEETIYKIALEVSQRAPEKSVFIDDRPLNLENPRRLGMNVIHHKNAQQLRSDLKALGVEV